MDVGREVLLEYLRHQRQIADYVYVAGSGLLIYDYFLTVGPEIVLIWSPPWNYTKSLFLLARYIPIINVYFVLYDQISMDNAVNSCNWTFQLATWLVTFGMFFAEVILAIRTWAVWRQDRRVGFMLAALLICAIVVECVCVHKFLNVLEFGPSLYPGFRGCYMVNRSNLLFVGFVTVGFVEIVVLVLMSISALRAYKLGDNSRLSNVIHRDGILFYVYLLCLAIGNIIAMLVLPQDLQTLLAPLQGVCYSVFVTRITINIRTASGRGWENSMSELHHGYCETEQIPEPLVFLPRAQLEENGEAV